MVFQALLQVQQARNCHRPLLESQTFGNLKEHIWDKYIRKSIWDTHQRAETQNQIVNEEPGIEISSSRENYINMWLTAVAARADAAYVKASTR